MIVIYAEKASLAKAIAVALKAGSRIAHPKKPVQCLHSQFASGKISTNNNSIPYQNKIGSGGCRSDTTNLYSTVRKLLFVTVSGICADW